MKKIYTTTFHHACNYGAVLQAYALQQTLLKKYDTEILNYNCAAIADVYRCFKRRSGSKKHQLTQLVKDILNYKIDYLRNQHFKTFRRNFLKETPEYKTAQDIIQHYPKGDIYITGSDQVWSPTITKGLDPIYTLNFGHHDFKKISYAASAGGNTTLRHDIKRLAAILQSYQAISVRERTLEQLLQANKVNDVNLTLDPSLLLTKEEWNKLIPPKKLTKQKYILAYSWDEPSFFFQIVNRFAQTNGYKIYYYRRRDYKHLFQGAKKSYFQYGPCEFLSLIKNAECVFTTSFHGTALSIIFNKKLFVTLSKYSDRITTLLSALGLSNRIVSSERDFDQILQKDIDWKKINATLTQKRQQSLQWLYNAIDKDTK